MRTSPRMAAGIMIGSAYDQQYTLERAWIDAGVARYHSLCQRATERGDAASLRASERLIVGWMGGVMPAVAASHAAMREGRPGKGFAAIADIATRLDPERSSLIAIRRVLSEVLRNPRGLLSSVAYRVGRDVVEQIHHDLYRGQFAADEAAVGRVTRHCSPQTLRKWLRAKDVPDYWSIRVCGGIGLWLTELVIANCLVYREGDEQWVPAFGTVLDGRGKRHAGYVITISPEASAAIDDGHAFRAFLRPRLAAMIVPPALWSDNGEGGYLSIRSPLVARQRRCHTKAFKETPPSHPHAGVNAMARVALRMNHRMVSLAAVMWAAGGGVAGMPPAEATKPPPRPVDGTDEEVAKWKREAAAVHSANASDRSTRFAFLTALNEARRLVAAGRFYQPHQIDFRGRCYAMPLALNHQMGDLPRSWFLFDEAKPLGERGEWWLRIHLANCWGLDKSPLADRVRWTHEHASLIRETAENPEDMTEWWSTADQPWQFVAVCMAMYDRSIAERLPIQIDGSANGLQHYAALGRDPIAAAAVNMRAAPPADPYLVVLDRVKPVVARDAGEGADHAAYVLPFVQRSVIKQTVMTVPYNVTRIGAGRQVRDNLRKAGLKGTAKQIGGAAGYLSGVVLDSIGDVFASAVSIMGWMEYASRAICQQDRTNLIAWTTPRGMRVVQPYMHERYVRIPTQQYNIAFRAGASKNDAAAQVRGTPPNVVHSLDADHMRSTAIACDGEGIEVMCVHDSVWMHAADADRVGQIVREEFVDLHREDFVADLCRQWREQYSVDLEDPPARGDWDIEECLSATYMFA